MTSSSYYYDADLRAAVETLLYSVQLPGQYVGGELGSVVKRPEDIRGRFCFAFPDVYTIGMSHYGMHLLYGLMNRRTDWACERVFTPLIDMEHALRSNCLPLCSLETCTPLRQFDVIGFSLQYEMMYTNVLTMLFMGQIPLSRQERQWTDPLVLAGGPCVSNPEPMSRFIDAFVIGDGEIALPAVCDKWLEIRDSYLHGETDPNKTHAAAAFYDAQKLTDSIARRREMLLELARSFPFLYVPEFYKVVAADTHFSRPIPTEVGVPETVFASKVENLDDFPPPSVPLVPLVESVQDRVTLEIMRGCPGRCRFCQSTAIKRPIRYRSPDNIAELALTACRNTGINELSLLALSASDYPQFESLLTRLDAVLRPEQITVSVPSLRVNHLLSEVMQRLSTEKSSALTIAPEAARDEMRKRINKPVTNENLLAGCRSAFENGFNRVKMYFMCGLPEETNDDIVGIVQLSEEVLRLGKQVRGRFPTVTASVANFVPKPHTEFERCAMQTPEYFTAAHQLLRRTVRQQSVSVKYHTLGTSILEAILCRGDRNVGHLIEKVWYLGARLDAWTEYHNPALWNQAIQESPLDVHRLIHTAIPDTAELPWSHISYQ